MKRKATAITFATIKAAKLAGFHQRRPDEYGGEEIVVKEHTLVRNAKLACSATVWGRRGYRIKKGVTPHANLTGYLSARQGLIRFDVFREDQVEPRQKTDRKPPLIISLPAALWVINRRAKRCRDMATKHFDARSHGFAKLRSREKSHLYGLKSQVLQNLINDGLAVHECYHRFPGDHWAEVLACDGYTFHRPCPSVEGVVVEERNEIEAKPKGAKEPRLKDALHTIEEFLKSRPTLTVYEWPPQQRPPTSWDYSSQDEDYYSRDDDSREVSDQVWPW
jgi:hypothetical protein